MHESSLYLLTTSHQDYLRQWFISASRFWKNKICISDSTKQRFHTDVIMDITQCSRAATTSPKPHIMEYNLNDSAKDILEADEELGFLLEFPSLRLMKN